MTDCYQKFAQQTHMGIKGMRLGFSQGNPIYIDVLDYYITSKITHNNGPGCIRRYSSYKRKKHCKVHVSLRQVSYLGQPLIRITLKMYSRCFLLFYFLCSGCD